MQHYTILVNAAHAPSSKGRGEGKDVAARSAADTGEQKKRSFGCRTGDAANSKNAAAARRIAVGCSGSVNCQLPMHDTRLLARNRARSAS